MLPRVLELNVLLFQNKVLDFFLGPQLLPQLLGWALSRMNYALREMFAERLGLLADPALILLHLPLSGARNIPPLQRVHFILDRVYWLLPQLSVISMSDISTLLLPPLQLLRAELLSPALAVLQMPMSPTLLSEGMLLERFPLSRLQMTLTRIQAQLFLV